MDHRKDLIKFAWNQLKAEDLTTKHWAYANVCRFISAYDTPPKIILQVYVALLRTCQPEFKDLIQDSLDTLVPSLPKRLRSDDFVKAMKWTKKVVFEEGHTLPQLIHVWNIIVRHAAIFYPFRSHFIPQMVSSMSRLGLPPNCPTEHRQVALACAETLIGWEFIRLKKLEIKGVIRLPETQVESTAMSPSNEKEDEFSLHSSMVQMLGNFLVRLGLFTADIKDNALSKLSDKCVSLYKTLVQIVPMSHIKISYFERLFKTFLENHYNASKSGGNKSIPKESSKATEEEIPANKARSGSSSQLSNLVGKGKAESSLPGELSERTLLILVQFLSVSMEASDRTANLVYENISLVKELLVPLFQSDHLSKLPLNTQFRKLMQQIFSTYAPSAMFPAFTETGFYQQLEFLLDNIFRTEYGEFSNKKETRSQGRDAKSSKPKVEQTGVPWTQLWSLQLVDDVCMLTTQESWIETIGGGLVSLCKQFLKKHVTQSQVSSFLSDVEMI
jgi:hypothetical protein